MLSRFKVNIQMSEGLLSTIPDLWSSVGIPYTNMQELFYKCIYWQRVQQLCILNLFGSATIVLFCYNENLPWELMGSTCICGYGQILRM